MYDHSCPSLLIHVMMIWSREVKILYINFRERALIRWEYWSNILLVLDHHPIIFHFHWNSFQFLPEHFCR